MSAPNYVHFTTLAANVLWGGNQLGFCEDGVQIQIAPQFDEIYSDDMGGRGGVPSDAQFLGARGFANMLFTKYDKQRMDYLSCFTIAAQTSTAKGLLPVLGSFVRQDSLAASLQLVAVNESLTFATAFLRQNFEINSGTRYRHYVCGFELWINQTDLSQLSQAQTRRIFTMS